MSYLTNMSTKMLTEFAVPQGSRSGPLLFILLKNYKNRSDNQIKYCQLKLLDNTIIYLSAEAPEIEYFLSGNLKINLN